MRTEKRVLIIYTGGTIGMIDQGNTVNLCENSTDLLQELIKQLPEITTLASLDLDTPFTIDSSDCSPEHWVTLANCIMEKWNQYDGFVILHGTDTLAYTSSALSLLFSHVTKPIILTGSQRPLRELRTDARSNVIDSIELATRGIPEVMVCFDSTIHLGSRVTKHSTEHFEAFCSHNHIELGHFGVTFKPNNDVLPKTLPQFQRPSPSLNARLNPNIFTITCTPGMNLTEPFREALLSSYEGFIIRAYGSGTLPILEGELLNFCRKATEAKKPIVIGTQCTSGSVSLGLYQNSLELQELGVLSGLDMTFEAMTVKLMCLLGRNIPHSQWMEFFYTPLCRECTSLF